MYTAVSNNIIQGCNNFSVLFLCFVCLFLSYFLVCIFAFPFGCLYICVCISERRKNKHLDAFIHSEEHQEQQPTLESLWNSVVMPLVPEELNVT